MAEPLTAVDLFAGCGGLSFGLQQAGFRVLAAIEKDARTGNTYAVNHGSVDLLVDDIRKVDPRRFRCRLGLKPRQLDLLGAGPPCQGFSAMRTRNGSKVIADSRNHLVMQVLRFAKELLPKVVLFENVPGVEDSKMFRDLVRGLRALGYQAEWRVDDLRYFAVPQRRRRLLLVATNLRGKPIPFGKTSSAIQTVRDVIRALPLPGATGDLLHDYPENRSLRIRRLIRRVPADGGGRLDLGRRGQLQCHLAFDGHKDTYGRMAWDRVAPTITTGCYNPSKGRFLHPTQDRCITMREAALLQTLPKSFEVASATTKTRAAAMIGNAVPPEYIRRNAAEIARVLRRNRT